MIYLDNHASTPCDPRVVEAMLPYFYEKCANAAIGLHRMGREANSAVERARGQVAALLGADPAEIIFTSGATESNNAVILGVGTNGTRRNIVSSGIEHKSVLEPCEELARRGWSFVKLGVNSVGCVGHGDLVASVGPDTRLVCVQAGNNEIGTLQDIRSFVRIAHAQGALMHCDAAQTVGKVPVNVHDVGVDSLSVSGHKIYGPKGIGALYLSRDARKEVAPLMYGGAQEHGFRPGTVPVPLCVGLGQACEIALSEMESERQRIAGLRDRMEKMLLEAFPGAHVNGDVTNRLPNNISLTIPGVDGESLALACPTVALSTGAACNAGAQEPSYVLRALGLSWDDALNTVRIGIGRFNTLDEMKAAGREIVAAAHALKG